MTIKQLQSLLEDLVRLIGDEAIICIRDDNTDPQPIGPDDWTAEPGRLILG